MKETPIRSISGIPMLLAMLAVIALCGWMVISGVKIGAPVQVVAGIVLGTAKSHQARKSYFMPRTHKPVERVV